MTGNDVMWARAHDLSGAISISAGVGLDPYTDNNYLGSGVPTTVPYMPADHFAHEAQGHAFNFVTPGGNMSERAGQDATRLFQSAQGRPIAPYYGSDIDVQK